MRIEGTLRPTDTVDAGGARIPRLGLGTWQLEGEACVRAVEEALALGFRHLDTAQMYENEEEVGEGLRRAGLPRDEVFVTTKIWREHLAADDVRRTAEASLERLDLDHVDLLLVHWPRADVPLEETLGAMRRLQEEGRVRHLGVSNFPVDRLEEALEIAPLVCDQVEYHPLLAQPALRRATRRHGLALVAYSPLAHGRVLREPAVRDVAARLGASPAQVALRWLVEQENVAAIPKASSRAHLEEDLAALALTLDAEARERLDTLSSRGERTLDPEFAPAWD
jgi:2,5-diketo-D-gluconate reductase B